jgi:hypothetical protein
MCLLRGRGDTPTKLYLDTNKKLPSKTFSHDCFIKKYKRIFYTLHNMQNILYFDLHT